MDIYDFNPHSRKGSDDKNAYGQWIYTISIHTPARGVTGFPASSKWCIIPFQSTLPHGEWLPQDKKERVNVEISIHTPARGVTFEI